MDHGIHNSFKSCDLFCPTLVGFGPVNATVTWKSDAQLQQGEDFQRAGSRPELKRGGRKVEAANMMPPVLNTD